MCVNVCSQKRVSGNQPLGKNLINVQLKASELFHYKKLVVKLQFILFLFYLF